MREILFRGKIIDSNKWAEGLVVELMDDEHGKCIAIIPNGCKSYRFEMNGDYVYPETVGQYTGLKDRNGKRIFEGDIVSISDEWWKRFGAMANGLRVIEVSFDEITCGFSPFADYDCDCGIFMEISACEVVGNIHDNPEMLDARC